MYRFFLKNVAATFLMITFSLFGYSQCPTGNVSGSVTISSSCSITTSLEIDGDLYLNGDLTIADGVVVTVTGNITTNWVGSTTTYTVSGGTLEANSWTTNNNSIIALSGTTVNLTTTYSGGYYGGLTMTNSNLNVGTDFSEGFQGGGGPVTLDNSSISVGGNFTASQNTDYELTNNSSISVDGNFTTGNSVDFTVTDSQLDVSGSVTINQYSNFNFTNSTFFSGGPLTTYNGVAIDLDNSDLDVATGNLTNGYQASINADNGSSISVSNGDLVMSNESTLDVTDADIIVEGSLDNNWLGDVNINSGGTVYVTDDVSNDGSITVDGGTLSYGGTYTGTGATSTSDDTVCSDGCCGTCDAYDDLERTLSRIYAPWETDTSWEDGSAPSTTGITQDISIFGYIYTGGSVSTASAGAKTLTVFDTLVIYGNLTFQGNDDELVIKPGGVLVILGDLTLKNKITVASGGIIAVSGNFTKQGSAGQGSYSGDGVVYSNSFDSGDDAWVDSGGGSDQSRTIDQLSDDGYADLENFITGGGASPLPISLLDFTAQYVDGSALLEWSTASEKNNDYFTISKSYDGVTFEKIAEVAGSGDSNETLYYDFRDYGQSQGVVYYQLSQTDFDGSYEIVSVKRLGQLETRINLSIYPNPVVLDQTSVQNATADMEWTLMDLSGSVLKRGNFLYSNMIDLPDGLPNGVYMLKVTGPGFFGTQRLYKK